MVSGTGTRGNRVKMAQKSEQILIWVDLQHLLMLSKGRHSATKPPDTYIFGDMSLSSTSYKT
jgi:hypothetical protein